MYRREKQRMDEAEHERVDKMDHTQVVVHHHKTISPELAQKYGVEATPTFFSPQGAEQRLLSDRA